MLSMLVAAALAADPGAVDPVVEQHAKAAIATAIATTKTMLDVEEFDARRRLESMQASIKRADNAKSRAIAERSADKFAARLKGLRVVNSRVIVTPYLSPGFLKVGDCGRLPNFLGESNLRIIAPRDGSFFDAEVIDRVSGRSSVVRLSIPGGKAGELAEIPGVFRVASEDRTGPRPVFVLEAIDLTPYLPTGLKLVDSLK